MPVRHASQACRVSHGHPPPCCPQVILLRHRVMPEYPDYDYYLWLDGDAAIIDHTLDMRLIPEMFPGGWPAAWQAAGGSTLLLATSTGSRSTGSRSTGSTSCWALTSCHAMPCTRCPSSHTAGATIYMSEDWWKWYPLHRANTGVLLFVNNEQLPELLDAWLDFSREQEPEVVAFRWGTAGGG